MIGFALGLALLAGSAHSATSRTGVIAFVRADGIYAMDVDGSHVHRLVRVPRVEPRWLAPIQWLAWSPDGTRLAY